MTHAWQWTEAIGTTTGHVGVGVGNKRRNGLIYGFCNFISEGFFHAANGNEALKIPFGFFEIFHAILLGVTPNLLLDIAF